jgi:hypothetical protein
VQSQDTMKGGGSLLKQSDKSLVMTRAKLLLKFSATSRASERIVFFAHRLQSTAEADADLARWAVVVAALNTIAANAAGLGQTFIGHSFASSKWDMPCLKRRVSGLKGVCSCDVLEKWREKLK